MTVAHWDHDGVGGHSPSERLPCGHHSSDGECRECDELGTPDPWALAGGDELEATTP